MLFLVRIRLLSPRYLHVIHRLQGQWQRALHIPYFYNMQNTLQQLDLFGMPAEAPVPARKKEKPAKMIVVSEPVQETAPTVVMAEQKPVVQALAVPEPQATTLQAQHTTTVRNSASHKKEGKPASKRGRKSFKEMDSEADLVEIPDDETLQQKLYYSISEVASWFKVNTSLLRYWENEFDILQPRKTRKGDRLFRVEDIKNLQLIYFLLRQRKFSIDGAKHYLKNNKQEANNQVRLVDSLTKFKSFLLELKANLQA